MLNIDWPTEWDPDFRETLRLRLETSLRNVMSKSRNSQLRGNVVVEDVFPGTVSPQVRLKHIHSLEPSLIAFSIAVRYEGDAYISLSGLEINLDTTSGTSNRKATKGKDSKVRGDRGGGGGGSQGGVGGEGENINGGENGASSRSHVTGSSSTSNNTTTTNNNASTNNNTINNNTVANNNNSNDEDGMYSGDANHSLPFYCPFAMRLCNIVIEDTVDVQIITRVVDERPEYYFGHTNSTTTTTTESSGGVTTSVTMADDSTTTTTSPSPASSPQQQGGSGAPSPTKGSTNPNNKKSKPVMPLHVLVKSLQYSEHIDATLPEEFAHILQHQNGRKVSGDAFGGGEGEPLASSPTLGVHHQQQSHSQMSNSAAALVGEVMRGDDLSGSTSSSSSANTGTPLQPLTTETLHKQQLLEKKKSDVINASARSAAESPRMEAVSMARSSIAGGSRTMDVLYGGRTRHAGGGGRQAPGGSNLYSVARRGIRGPGSMMVTPRPSSTVPQRKDSTTSGVGGRGGGGDKSSGSSGSIMDPHLRQTSWSGGTHHTTPDNLAPPSICSGNTLRTSRAAVDVPHRLPVAVIRTPRDEELKAGGALPIQSIIRRGGGHHNPMMVGGGGTSSGNSPPHSTSYISRVLTPISKLGGGGGSKGMNSSSLTTGGGWPMHRGGWGSSFAFAAGAPQIHAAGKRAEINTRQRDFLASCLEPFAPYYPEGLSFLPAYWNLSAYNHITGAGSALDSVVSQAESQCKSFADLFVFGRFKRVQKGAVSRREQLFGGHDEDDQSTNNTPKGGTTIRLQFFSDPVKSFNVTSNFGTVHTRVNATIESTLRNLVQPAIDKLLIEGIEFTV